MVAKLFSLPAQLPTMSHGRSPAMRLNPDIFSAHDPASQLLRLGKSSNFRALALESEIFDPHAFRH